MEEFASRLFDEGAIQFGYFEDKNGTGAFRPYHLDLHGNWRGDEGPLSREMIVTWYEESQNLIRRRGLSYDHVCGISHEARPLASLYPATHFQNVIGRIKLFTNFAEREPTKGICSACYTSGETVLLFAAATHTGEEEIQAIETLRAAGLIVRDVVTLIDCEEGASRALAAFGIRLHAVYGISQLIDFYVDQELIPGAVRTLVSTHLKAA